MATEKLDFSFGQDIQEEMSVNGQKYTPKHVSGGTGKISNGLISCEREKDARLCETPSRSVRRVKQKCIRILDPVLRKTYGFVQTPVCSSSDSLNLPLRTSAGAAPSPMHASFWSMDTPATQPRGLVGGRMPTPLGTLDVPGGHSVWTPGSPMRLSMSTVDTPLRRSLWTSNTPRRSCTGCLGNGPATPRRQLVRVTENAIESFVKEDIESNIPVIRHLENISYKLWVESNTAFLSEAAMTDDADDDGWIWDEDCFFSSSPDSDDINSLRDADTGSSIGSSIRVCGDSDCSLGYLASCESLETCTIQSPQCGKLCGKNRNISIRKRNNYSRESPQVSTPTNSKFDTEKTRINTVLDHVNACGNQRDVAVAENAQNDDLLLDNILFSYNSFQESVPRLPNGSSNDTAANDEDEWVIVDDDCVPEVSGAGAHSYCRGRSSPVEIKSGQVIGTSISDSKKDVSMETTGSMDLSEWTILSLNITERKQKDRVPRADRSNTDGAKDKQRALIFETVREALRQLGMDAGNNVSSSCVTSGVDTRARGGRREGDETRSHNTVRTML